MAKRDVQLIASGDLRLSANQVCWPAQKAMEEILDLYPKVKGVQIMNDQGTYMFDDYARQWIPDTPARRKAIIERMKHWEPYSESSPVRGLKTALNTYRSAEKKVSIYYLGDDFSDEEIQPVLDAVDRLNPPDASGHRQVRIHAIGFPMPDRYPQYTAQRYAALMRVLCERNGGAFVGLNS